MKFASVLRRLAPTFIVLALAAPVAAIDLGSPTPQLSEARADIDAGNWDAAVEKLRLIVDANNTNADAYSLLGYALRHTGAHDRAMQAYNRALKIDPGHTGAVEYQGELYVIMGDVDGARANLARLEAICGTGCEPYLELAAAIDAPAAAATRTKSWG